MEFTNYSPLSPTAKIICEVCKKEISLNDYVRTNQKWLRVTNFDYQPIRVEEKPSEINPAYMTIWPDIESQPKKEMKVACDNHDCQKQLLKWGLKRVENEEI